ncbi:hypothetical protein EGL67_04075 [Vibrio parahaemolyticus]|nr:hypothetical protein [Vibrio parahaemolyticus]EGR0400209.1 hypothetical protein [Vibrio parahaemolyticus]EGR3397924.1 hypothetical protein [Vibrio parahaemolyticus]OKY47075.1 hypothetical protein BUL36_19820 [Vibrio parahaemolyticus]PJR24467.1 hypothetical protein CFG65_14020 [Vibrio parahaemolyticus]
MQRLPLSVLVRSNHRDINALIPCLYALFESQRNANRITTAYRAQPDTVSLTGC